MPHNHTGHLAWDPPARCSGCGHRIALRAGERPIQTRSLGWRAILAEYPMRWLARFAGRHPYDSRIWHQEELNE